MSMVFDPQGKQVFLIFYLELELSALVSNYLDKVDFYFLI